MSKKLGWVFIFGSLGLILLFEGYLLGIAYVLPAVSDYEGYAVIEAPVGFVPEYTPEAYIKMGVIHKKDAERIRDWTDPILSRG